MDVAYQWIMSDNNTRAGLCREAAFPYKSGTTGEEGACDTHYCHAPVTMKGYTNVENNEYALSVAVAKTPVSVGVAVDKNFQLYRSGVLSKCGDWPNHAVLVAGYGWDYTYGAYWLVKNSWGSSFGEEGYVRVKRTDRSDSDGMCHIATDATYVTAQKE